MATLGLGSMVVQLDLDGADFIRNTGQARQALGQLPHEIDRTSNSLHLNRTAVRLASRGLGELTGLSGTVIFGFERMTEAALGASGAFAKLGQAGLVVAAGAGAFFLGQGLAEQIRNLRDYGELVGTTAERLKIEAEEQKRFAADRRTAAVSVLALQKDQLAAESELAGIREKAAGDEVGMAEVIVAGKLKALEVERRERERAIVENVKNEFGRAAQLVALAQVTATKRVALEAAFALQVQEIQKAAFVRDTNALIEHLQTQIKTRQDFDARTQAALGRQGFTGGPLAGFAKVGEFQRDVRDIAAGFRDLIEQGVPIGTLFADIQAHGDALAQKMAALREQFAGSPAVLSELDRALGAVDFFDFSKTLFSSTLALRGFDDMTRGGAAGVTALAERLAQDLPAGVNAADPQIQKLTQSMAALKAWVDATNGSVGALVANLIGAAQAQATPASVQVFEEP